jgi:hypothetical protein
MQTVVLERYVISIFIDFELTSYLGHWRKPPVTVTTRKHLQDTITEVSDCKRTTGLTIIAMEGITEIFFRVESPKIFTLRILRGDQNIMPQSGLFVSGASEFDGTHLPDWKNRLHDDKELRLGRGVHISLDYERSRPMSEAKETLPPEEQEQEQDTPRQVPEPNQESGWWSRWKSTISRCVGLVVASAVLYVKGGIPTTFTYFQASWLGIKVTAATSATGASIGACVAPVAWALVLGAAAALAVYYIPYGSVYSWLGKQWRTFHSILCKLWGSRGDGSEDRCRVPPMATV